MEEAKIEEARSRFSTVLVLFKRNVSDEQMAQDAWVEGSSYRRRAAELHQYEARTKPKK
jgi:hypothetical protein